MQTYGFCDADIFSEMEIIQVDDNVALLYDMRVEGTVDVIDGLFDVDGSMRLSDTGTFVSAIDRINDWFSTFSIDCSALQSTG